MVATPYCPTCEPERDPLKEILDARYCHRHEPSRAGSEDDGVALGWISGTADCTGDDNRKWCDLLHRRPHAE
jgi:hypothetical protein